MGLKSLIVKYVEANEEWRDPSKPNPPFDGPGIKVLMKNKRFLTNRIKVMSGARSGKALYADKLVYVKGEGTETFLSCDVLGKFFRDEFGWEEVDIYKFYHEYKEDDKRKRFESLKRHVNNMKKLAQQVEKDQKS